MCIINYNAWLVNPNPVHNIIHSILLHFLTIFIYSQTTWMSLLMAFMSFLRLTISFFILFKLFSWSLFEFPFSVSKFFSDKIFVTFLKTQLGKLKLETFISVLNHLFLPVFCWYTFLGFILDKNLICFVWININPICTITKKLYLRQKRIKGWYV